MSQGVHAVQHEAEHAIQHDAAHSGSGVSNVSSTNKKLALVIAVLALFLSLAEGLGKSAQTAALNSQIEASDLWNFFQAKNVRRTSNLIAADQAQLSLPGIADPGQRAATEKQIAKWTETAERYRRAEEAEHHRDEMLAKYHNYEFASSAFQIGIVLASAAVITGLAMPGFLASGLALLIGLAFTAFGMFAPNLLHLH